ncbi:MAG: flavin reductase family protein [Candidatus Altiarchaeum hamiconexum]|uniref:Flavin reductase family protein n=1 Tax=Candidatus Altarchaeum hamiconexum TaxID=1803513 RepID=A0A8J7YVB0_9ARCH|nr:flavin reductase family protein [Candidatus Altarchaeum hamiconexum]OIQ06052.1 MAG: hypothetical protein AUK59_01355 [Candidatus Altarchaeum sp. CG2_30_32_3053]PIN68208.1 MAG: hypothetical protein COV98_00035 [Candidatus Altarchaeum sp. CG12_big_fil_rev_8_21_14_0_65_33_22]PIV28444.1 MAG: hypothetical protein COS36_02135 [Candidatus Altarchaeum sp. CG03_land_8_20_14_0_80_32_618]PIX48410.1 MAG: hypothetical protein COZ53_04155 [Candidatus Altarchaeum sp. CG_4_8_14_3_um_filter_33_2054]PIZ32884
MEIKNFYKLLAPRPTVLISTTDEEGNPDVAPFSFVMPVAWEPPLVAVSFANTRKTLKNIMQTKEFVINIPTEEILPNLWKCAQYSGNERNDKFSYANLTAEKSRKVNVPGIKECAGRIECKLEFEKEVNDRVLVVGSVVECEGREGICLLHIGRNKFGISNKVMKI